MLEGRTPTAEEKAWLLTVAQIPCIVCTHFHGVKDTPAEVHHLEGRTIDGAHLKTIPLCTRHHRQKDNFYPPRWASRHGDSRPIFERRYTSEDKLLKLTHEAAAELSKHTVGSPYYDANYQ